MSLFASTIVYRLKTHVTTLRGIVMFVLGMLLSVSPFIGLIIPDAPIPIGWIDRDNSPFSQLLKENVQALDVVCLFEYDEETLVANLQTGKIEGVFIINDGFEEDIKSGEFEETLTLLRSPYSTAAGVISESVGGEAMRLWLTCYSANVAEGYGGESLYDRVFAAANAGTDAPIISLGRINQAAQTDEETPIKDAAFTSLYLLAAFVCFYMLAGLALTGRDDDFASRLKSRAFSLERYRMAVSIADAIYILPCVIPPLVAFGAANAGGLILPLFVMFILYVLAYGGIASLVAKIGDQTALMLSISVITIANVLFGSMLVKLPQAGVFSVFTHILPSRWLSSLDAFGALWCMIGLFGFAAIYTALPFLFRKKEI